MESKDKNSLLKVFISGISFFFTLEGNPIREYYRRYGRKSDAERIYGDWCNVGNDIRKAYGKATASRKGC